MCDAVPSRIGVNVEGPSVGKASKHGLHADEKTKSMEHCTWFQSPTQMVPTECSCLIPAPFLLPYPIYMSPAKMSVDWLQGFVLHLSAS